MHKPGHLGASLLAYAPLMALLIALEQPLTAFVGLGVAGSLAMLPDIDQRLPRIKHRGASHTVWTPLAVGVGVAAAAHSAVGLAAVFAVGVYTGIDRLVPGLRRRGALFSYAAPLGIGVAAWSLLASSTTALPYFEYVIGAAAAISVGAHLLADTITPAGLTPFYPITDAHYSLGLVTADNTIANFGLLLAGVAAVGAAVVYAPQLPF